MKKTLGVVAAAAMAALPMASVLAVDNLTFTDNLAITIDSVCTLTRQTSGHAAGTDAGSWSGDTLSKTITAGQAYADLGSSSFNVQCNNDKGYKVTLDAEGLEATGVTNGITYITTAAAPTNAKSEWGVKIGTTYITDGEVVKTSSTATANAGDDFSVTYSVSAKDGQAAGSYEGHVTYTLAQLNA